MRVLLVEDERRMADALCELLRQEGYDVDWLSDGAEVFLTAENNIYDAIILDVMLPNKNGFDIAKELRGNGISTPILMLTAKSEVDDKVHGLDCGADDYLTKPFMTKELLARIRALTRRGTSALDNALRFGDISLDQEIFTMTCTNSGMSVRLGDKEFRILEYMIANKGTVLSRQKIAMKVWGFESDAEYNNVEVYISFTRKKLAFVKSKVTIKAIRGLGYELQYDQES